MIEVGYIKLCSKLLDALLQFTYIYLLQVTSSGNARTVSRYMYACLRSNEVHIPSFTGTSYIRICIGASDMMAVSPYTYDDLENNNDTDFNMEHFSIDKDKDFVIPILKEALEINPNLKIMGSPWSAPAWMKFEHKLFGGTFNDEDPQFMEALALYLVKFIQAYEAEGIPIESFTVQNEPTIERFDYPTMIMNVSIMTEFIKHHLGPLMQQNNMTTKLLIWDFNWIDPWYPDALLQDGNCIR